MPTLERFGYGKKKPPVSPAPGMFPTVPNPTQYSQPIGPQINQTPIIPQVKPVVASPISPVTQKPAITPVLPQITSSTYTTPSGTNVDAQGQVVAPPPVPSTPTGTNQAAPGATSTPTLPQVSPETLKSLGLAESVYQQSLKISPEELSTQEDIDKLVDSTKTAYRNTSGQAIPLEFITGQLRSIEQRATGLAEPLERKLARMQATRQSSLESSKFALDRAENKVQTEKEALKPISGTSFYDPTTGKFIQAPSVTTEKEKGFTLQPGEIRYDEQGKPIAQGGPKPPSATAEAKTIEKQESIIKGKSDATGGLALVNEILNSPYINQVFGVKNPFTYWAPGSNEQLVKSQRDQLTAMLSLENRSKLKGSGAISDFEARTLEKAASALNKSLSDSDAKRVLKQIKGAFATSSGIEADVKVTNPSGEVISATATRNEINQLISEGNTVEYQ